MRKYDHFNAALSPIQFAVLAALVGRPQTVSALCNQVASDTGGGVVTSPAALRKVIVVLEAHRCVTRDIELIHLYYRPAKPYRIIDQGVQALERAIRQQQRINMVATSNLARRRHRAQFLLQ